MWMSSIAGAMTREAPSTRAGLSGEWRFAPEQSSDSEYRFAFSPPSKATSNGKSPPARMAGAAGKAASASTETAKNAVRRSGIQVDDQPARKKQPAAEEMAARDQKRVKRTARR